MSDGDPKMHPSEWLKGWPEFWQQERVVRVMACLKAFHECGVHAVPLPLNSDGRYDVRLPDGHVVRAGTCLTCASTLHEEDNVLGLYCDDACCERFAGATPRR